MFTYPQLTPREQMHLPELTAAPTALASKYEDSTHQLWHCETHQGELILKVCQEETVVASDFWPGMNQLFAADFPSSLGKADSIYHFVRMHGALEVPDLIASSASRFVLARYVDGQDMDTSSIQECDVIALANHIGMLHQHTYKRWGKLYAPEFTPHEWTLRLQQSLQVLAQKLRKPSDIVLFEEVVAHVGHIHETEFVLVMMDFRWDQLRRISTGGLALLDLDAFVIAPKSLDLVLLSCALSPTQFALFKEHYSRWHAWPDFQQQKSCYLLLLFLMNILGETDLARWMART